MSSLKKKYIYTSTSKSIEISTPISKKYIFEIFQRQSGYFCASPVFSALVRLILCLEIFSGFGVGPLHPCATNYKFLMSLRHGQWTRAWRISIQFLKVYGSFLLVLIQFSTASCPHKRQREVRYKSKVRCAVVLGETRREYLASWPTNPSSIWQESHSGDSCHSTRAASSCMNRNVCTSIWNLGCIGNRGSASSKLRSAKRRYARQDVSPE